MSAAELALIGTVLLALGGLLGKWVESRASRAGSKPDLLATYGAEIERLWTHSTNQDERIEALQQAKEVDKRVRHDLKGALAYVVSIAKQAITSIIENYTAEQIDALPEPLRSYVQGQIDFDHELELTRARVGL